MKKGAYFIGHSHIDAVWLWDREETKEVLKNTFGKVLDLMDNNPDFYFIQSSAQFYKWMEELSPELFERIKQYVNEGRWEITGGMWIEPDTNGISGESYARQIYYGKRYFREKFGIDIKLAWLPDSFGYPNTLPMILNEGGIKYFYTAKLNFEHPLHFPYYIFRWLSPDGSEVLSVHTFRYEGNPDKKSVKSTIGLASIMHPNYDRFLVVYGEGDHGGGISQEMIDNIRSLRDEGKVEVETGKAIDYYKDLNTHKALFPIWDDELYLKTHHGTYTTQGNFRRKNRYLEGLLYKTELWATIASSYGYNYPKEEIDKLWKILLFNQFHDALAGSSIPKVYEDAWKDLVYVENEAKRLKNDALSYIKNGIGAKDNIGSFLVFNPLNFPVSDIIEYKGEIIYVKDVPPFGYKDVDISKKEDIPMLNLRAGEGEIKIENEFLSFVLSEETGAITSIFNKKIEKEFLVSSGNLIQVYEDDDLLESAWNIHLGRENSLRDPETIRVIKDSPIFKEIEVVYKYNQEGRPDSTIKMYVSLDAFSPYIRVRLWMDLYTQKRTYKIAFPLNVETEYTTYDAPYGYIERIDPISPNAGSFERYKIEVPGGKWVTRDGFTLINDGRFGFDIGDGKTLRMTIARTVRYPKPIIMALDGPLNDVYTDQGEMELTYLIYPHGNSWKDAKIPYLAWQFNVGLDILPERKVGNEKSLFYFSKDVILTALKKDDKGRKVVRFYEPLGASPFIEGSFIKSNIMENEGEELKGVNVRPLSLNTLIVK